MENSMLNIANLLCDAATNLSKQAQEQMKGMNQTQIDEVTKKASEMIKGAGLGSSIKMEDLPDLQQKVRDIKDELDNRG